MLPTLLKESLGLLDEKEKDETAFLCLADEKDNNICDTQVELETRNEKQKIEDSSSFSSFPPPKSKKLREKKLQCNYPNCSATFNRPDRLRTHIDVNHVHILRYQCPSCQESFANQNYLTRHINRMHKKIKMTKVKSNLTSEIELSNLPTDELGVIKRGVPCPSCARIFRRKCQLRLHRAEVHGEPLPHQCSHCPAAFPLLYKLRRHEASVHQPRFYRCAFTSTTDCTFTTDKFSLLRKHHATGHPEVRLKCTTCGKFYRRADSLRVHEEIAHGQTVPVFACDRPGCIKTYSRESCLRTHLRNSHDAPRFGPCEKCGGRFRHSKTFRQHKAKCVKVPIGKEENFQTKESTEKELKVVKKESVPKKKERSGKNPVDEENRKAVAAYRRRLQRLPPVVYEDEVEENKDEVEDDEVDLVKVDQSLPSTEGGHDDNDSV